MIGIENLVKSFGSNLLLDSPLLNTLSPDRLEAMKQAGMLMHDLRETAGLTIEDLSKSLDMADTSLLKAVENEVHNRRRGAAVRLEAEHPAPGKLVVHDYGHGGAGVTLNGVSLLFANSSRSTQKRPQTPAPVSVDRPLSASRLTRPQ